MAEDLRKLDFSELDNFLKDNKLILLAIADTNECRKWSKWVNRNERPFPCVCPTRNEDCVFAETYYKLNELSKLSNYLQACEDAILDFQSIKGNRLVIMEWLSEHEELNETISNFENNISITISDSPYQKISIKVDYPNIIKDFISLYQESNQ